MAAVSLTEKRGKKVLANSQEDLRITNGGGAGPLAE